MARAKKEGRLREQRTTIRLTEEQYLFLKEKALELTKEGKPTSIASIIRELVEKDRKEWVREKGKGVAFP